MSVDRRVAALRLAMEKINIQAFIIPSSDPHQSEYVTDHWKSREWISGFTGSAGTAIVSHNHAGLWTDSRYFLQGETELANSEYVLHKVYDQFAPSHTDWLCNNLQAGETVGVDGLNISVNQFKALQLELKAKDIHLKDVGDLFESIWSDRPTLPKDKAFIHDEAYQGDSMSNRIKQVQKGMKEKEHFLFSALDDIAWLLHLRGRDVESNPVAIAYVLMNDHSVCLYIDPDKLDEATLAIYQKNKVTLKAYKDILQDLKTIPSDESVIIDKSIVSQHFYSAIKANVQHRGSIIRQLKAIKTDKEIAHFRNCMIKDGVALTKAFMWLEDKVDTEEVSEYDFAMKLASCRSEQGQYFGESFNAIIGYAGNGAIIHYRPMPDTSLTIKPAKTLLCDSGGQYYDGTTDITRTIVLEESIDPSFIEAYTAVLQGMIDLEQAIIPEGTYGVQMDMLARQHLWAKGLNYLHGTGHGVGYFLNVHEPPQGFTAGPSPRSNTVMKAGMITSNEPGYYKEGHFGIRIENLILTKEHTKEGFLCHESITLFPIDMRPVNIEVLSDKQINWINEYHQEVYKKISPHLNEEEKTWLHNKCLAIAK